MNPGFFAALIVLLAGVGLIVTSQWLGKRPAWRERETPLYLMITGIGILVFSLPTALFIGALFRWLP